MWSGQVLISGEGDKEGRAFLRVVQNRGRARSKESPGSGIG